MLGTKVKVIGEASSFRSTEDYDYVLYYSKIKTADGKTYFIDSNKLTDEKPDMRPRFTYTKQEPKTMYFYNTAPLYSLNFRDGTLKEKKKIKARTKVTVLGKASQWVTKNI